MCDKIISKNPFMLKYFPDKHLTQKMCNEAVDGSVPTLNFVPEWFVTSKMIKKLFIALYVDENVLYFDEDSGNVVFNCSERDIHDIDLKNINLDNDFNEDDPGTIIHVILLACHTRFEKRKALKKESNEELLPVIDGGIGACQKMGKKEVDPTFTEES